MEEYIKPCPFCGGDGTLHSNYSYKAKSYFVFVKCSFCGGQGKTYNSPEDPPDVDWKNTACIDAIKAWNRRIGE